MATAPRPGAGRRQDAEGVAIMIKVGDDEYTFRPAEVTGRQASELRKASGQSVQSLMRLAQEDPDLDVFGGIVFLARRQAGEEVTYDEVLDGLDYGTSISSEVAGATDEQDDSPEA